MKFYNLIFFIFTIVIGFSQNQGNIWYFGDHAGLDFNSGVPVVINNGATYIPASSNYSEGTSTISDPQGNLLFYTNGEKLWNKQHQVMPNGDFLSGNFSSTQSSIIIPLPNSNRFFYVFTTDDIIENTNDLGFRYSVIDNCLDNGFGDIITTQKNVLLSYQMAEKVAAVKHSNGIDYWIITHKLNTNEFYSYLLTENGITDSIISAIGETQINSQGQLKISPNGSKLAVAHNKHWLSPFYFELFDFNSSTGIVSNAIALSTPTNTAIYGVEFSPDNSKLYGVYSGTSPFGMGIVQYDLSTPTSSFINNSMISVYQASGITFRGLQLAPNGKIYMPSVPTSNYLLEISSPNLQGGSCGVINNSIDLGTNSASYCLPSFIAGYNYSNNNVDCQASLEEIKINNLEIFPNPVSQNTVEIKFKSKLEDCTIYIYNSLGENILITPLINDSITIDCSHFYNGLHFVEVHTDSEIISREKLIILK